MFSEGSTKGGSNRSSGRRRVTPGRTIAIGGGSRGGRNSFPLNRTFKVVLTTIYTIVKAAFI